MPVFFESCWVQNDSPKLGPQPAPVPRKQMSAWRQSPSKEALVDPTQYPRLKAYVQGVIERFKDDDRILMWDIWNEAEIDQAEAKTVHAIDNLLSKAFKWAREARPTQPLTSAPWNVREEGWARGKKGKLNSTEKIEFNNSDIITFHSYDHPEYFDKLIRGLKDFGRPIICTEFMARKREKPCTFAGILPLLRYHNVGGCCWSLVNGKTNTDALWPQLPQPEPGTKAFPFHGIFNRDLTPCVPGEPEFIQQLIADIREEKDLQRKKVSQTDSRERSARGIETKGHHTR